jgi:cell division inhibitor SepF
VLLLRGEQAPGELHTRTERLHGFADRHEVEACLEQMASRPQPLVRELERRPGQRDARWMHLLGAAAETTDETAAAEDADPSRIRVTQIIADLHVPDLPAARSFYSDYLGLADDRSEHEDYLEEYDDQEVAVPQEYEAQVTPLHRPTRTTLPTQAAPQAPVAGELRRITTIHPRSYNDARKIGEAFREGTPVIMNLTDMDDADAKRLVDFSAGLIFGLHGAIERVTSKVFLLSPAHVEVAGEAAGPAAEPPTRAGFYNQS